MAGLEGFNSNLFQNDIAGLANTNSINNADAVTQGILSNTGYWNPGSSSGWDWLGNNGILPTAFMGLQTLAGGLNTLTGLQQLQLARDQFDFSKNVANANLNNSVENYYNAIKNANRVGYALQGGYARKAYGANSQEAAATNAADEATKNLTRHV